MIYLQADGMCAGLGERRSPGDIVNIRRGDAVRVQPEEPVQQCDLSMKGRGLGLNCVRQESPVLRVRMVELVMQLCQARSHESERDQRNDENPHLNRPVVAHPQALDASQ